MLLLLLRLCLNMNNLNDFARRNPAAMQIVRDQRVVAFRGHGIPYREPRERVLFVLLIKYYILVANFIANSHKQLQIHRNKMKMILKQMVTNLVLYVGQMVD